MKAIWFFLYKYFYLEIIGISVDSITLEAEAWKEIFIVVLGVRVPLLNVFAKMKISGFPLSEAVSMLSVGVPGS